MIPKTIFTIWLGGEPPETIRKCIESQKIPGYEHRLITNKNCPKDIPYVSAAIQAKKWVKAADWLRMHYLYTDGGIYLDADVEIIPGRNFDSLLGNAMFAAREKNGFIGTAIIGASKGYSFLKPWMDEVQQNFKGDDDKNFESSMDILVRGYFEKGWPKEGFALVPTETLYPYNHQSGEINVTNETITFHHFLKSWSDAKEVLPRSRLFFLL